MRDYEPAVNWMNSIYDELLISGFTYLELIDGCENQEAIDKLKKSLSPYSIVYIYDCQFYYKCNLAKISVKRG